MNKGFQYWCSKLIGLKYPVLKSEDNIAKGEIVKFNFVEGQRNQLPIGRQTCHTEEIEGKWYDCISVQLGNDYFKRIGQWEQSPWTCQ